MSMENERKMTFWEHLEELRVLIVQCLVVILIGCGVVGIFFAKFAKVLSYPLDVALRDNSQALQGLVTTSPMGVFSVLMEVCFFGGVAVALPVIVWLIARFLSPGLYAHEKRLLIPCGLAILALFLVGASFSYFFVLPASLSMAIHLNQVFGFELIWSAPQYYGLVVWMTLGVGLCFEFPLVLLVLIYFGALSTEKLKKIRRYVIVMILIAVAAITPTSDAMSLAMLAVPLYVLYELSIWLGERVERRKQARVLAENF